jgi:hypothetical protein
MSTEENMFREVMGAISQGQRARARDLLTRLLKTNQGNVEYWLWMSSVVDTPQERIYCLETILRLEPNNPIAKRGLILAAHCPCDVAPSLPAQMERNRAQETRPAADRVH